MINRMHDYDSSATKASPLTSESASQSSLIKRLHIDEVEEFARQHPVAVLVVGLAAGITLGWWVKRK